MGAPSPPQVDTYRVGDIVTMRATFVSTDHVTLADPSLVFFSVVDGWGHLAGSYTYGQAGASVIRTATGCYFKDFSIPHVATAPGQWQYRAEGTGYVQAADEWAFRVEKTVFML
jgi:hypothetical protein